ncbi:DUF1349 domain-containing protein [Paenibacillus cremeus]|uniref:DUF1349 domain-containing protein n=1 Tax=Paenibacillus cremeus TaxID=2163881 RepID=A0A559K512_9BACL|nr:DUF1349 domain-containing protein [Paenibacillus cremeus]TVY07173.1 DUF1349 domain-containing protein [Paenibacillus cremeus]
MNSILLTGTDIGSPALQGVIEQLTSGYRITAGGADIWGTSDEFHFAYMQYTGDFDLTVRIEALSSANLYTKAGIMARESLEADSAHAYFLVFPDNRPRNKNNGGYEYQYREVKGGDSAAIYPPDYTSMLPKFPVQYPQTWLRLERRGSLFQAWYRAEGDDWKLFTEKELAMNPSILLGLAVTSHNRAETATAQFVDINLI